MSMMPTQNDGMPKVTVGRLRDKWSGRLVALHRGQDGEGDRHDDREQRGHHEQQDRRARARGDERRGRQLVEERPAEVAVDEAVHEQEILLQQGPVEAPLVMKSGDQIRGRAGTEKGHCGVSRDHVDHEEHEDRDAEDGRHRQQESFGDVGSEVQVVTPGGARASSDAARAARSFSSGRKPTCPLGRASLTC